MVRAFFDGKNRQIDTGDPSSVKATYNAYCTRCADTTTAIQVLFNDRHRVRGAHFHIVSIDGAYPTDRKIVAVLVTDREDEGEQVDAQGTVTQTFDAVPPTGLIFYVYLTPAPPTIAGFEVRRT